ncbi:hypothetical protein Rhopal_003428-T1 [Rhodotorula paludigena]|uniref:Monocarboxylate transporter n=1 Tax=Rhodotorula paludigena TaxID=86838 RepID=A0AAV5GM21_9BASI|nr:hypothetical protein Rhopal_003428-T1 [Rhodotorula paludigena]
MPSPSSAAADTVQPSGTDGSTPTATVVGSIDVEKHASEEKDLEGGAAPVEPATAPPPGPPPFPNGGKRAYLTTLGGVLVLFTTFGLSNSWAAFQAELSNHQLNDYTASSISWIGSVQLWALFVCGLPSGSLFDRGYFQYQLAVGSVLWIFGMFMLSLSKEYYQFFLSYAICLGAVVYPIQLNHLFRSQGFAPAVRSVAYIHVGFLLFANLLMRPRNDIPPRKPPPALPLIGSFLKEPRTWFVCLGCAFVMLGMFIPIFYVQVFVQTHGADEVVVTYAVFPLTLGGKASTTHSRQQTASELGLLADRFGNLTVGLGVTTLIGGMIFAMLGATSTGGAVAFCIVYGAASGAWVTIMAPSLISLANSVREFGTRGGLGMLFVSFSALIGTPIAGAILRATPSSDDKPSNYTGVRRKGTWRV